MDDELEIFDRSFTCSCRAFLAEDQRSSLLSPVAQIEKDKTRAKLSITDGFDWIDFFRLAITCLISINTLSPLSHLIDGEHRLLYKHRLMSVMIVQRHPFVFNTSPSLRFNRLRCMYVSFFPRLYARTITNFFDIRLISLEKYLSVCQWEERART